MKNLKEISNEDLRLELERRGYFTENLWHTDDVIGQLEYYNIENPDKPIMEKELDCNKILNGALTNEWITEQIYSIIYQEIEYINDKAI
jgi:hypothetical protein